MEGKAGGEGIRKAKPFVSGLRSVFGCPPEWFRQGKRDRNRGLVSGVLQIIDIPQLKLSTFTGGGGDSDARSSHPCAGAGPVQPRQPTARCPWSRSALLCAQQQPAEAGSGIAGPEERVPGQEEAAGATAVSHRLSVRSQEEPVAPGLWRERHQRCSPGRRLTAGHWGAGRAQTRRMRSAR